MTSLGLQPVLFKAAAILTGLMTIGHWQFGVQTLYGPWKTLPTAAAKLSYAEWNYAQLQIILSALLEWQWANTGGPQTTEEKLMLAAIAGLGALTGWRFGAQGAYPALIVMWGTPAMAVIASFFVRGG